MLEMTNASSCLNTTKVNIKCCENGRYIYGCETNRHESRSIHYRKNVLDGKSLRVSRLQLFYITLSTFSQTSNY